LGDLQAQFDLSADGSVKAKITSKGRTSVESWEGTKFLKYWN